MMKRRISNETAEKEYGVLTRQDTGLSYYLTEYGVVDSDDQLRYGRYNGYIVSSVELPTWTLYNSPDVPEGYNRYCNFGDEEHKLIYDWFLVKKENDKSKKTL